MTALATTLLAFSSDLLLLCVSLSAGKGGGRVVAAIDRQG